MANLAITQENKSFCLPKPQPLSAPSNDISIRTNLKYILSEISKREDWTLENRSYPYWATKSAILVTSGLAGWLVNYIPPLFGAPFPRQIWISPFICMMNSTSISEKTLLRHSLAIAAIRYEHLDAPHNKGISEKLETILATVQTYHESRDYLEDRLTLTFALSLAAQTAIDLTGFSSNELIDWPAAAILATGIITTAVLGLYHQIYQGSKLTQVKETVRECLELLEQETHLDQSTSEKAV